MSDEAISALATFGAAAIAGFVALWIATRVYVQQKAVDLNHAQTIEKRAAFKVFFQKAAEVHTELRAALYRADDRKAHFDLAEERLHELYAAQDVLALVANEAAIRNCRKYVLGLLGLRAYVRHALFGAPLTSKYAALGDAAGALQSLLDAREAALTTARSDVLLRSQSDSEKALQGLFERMDISEELEIGLRQPLEDKTRTSDLQ